MAEPRSRKVGARLLRHRSSATAADDAEDADDSGGEDEDDDDDDVMVTVQGVQMPLSSVTDEDQDRMTQAEYEEYFKLYQAAVS